MSETITAKNLSYKPELPPFLAALHARAAGSAGAPDAILAARRRPGKARSGSEEAEDAPLVVDEVGNTVDVKVSKDGTVEPTAEMLSQQKGQEESALLVERRDAEKRAEIGGSKKRKAGKVVGAVAEDSQECAPAGEEFHMAKGATIEASKGRTGAAKEKKRKKIKLSFDPE